MPAHLHTVNLYKFDDVVSALQKSIRRCDAPQALFWAGELERGFKHILYSRLWTIVAEDIGLAAPFLALDLFSYYQEWKANHASNPTKAQELTIQMVLTLAQAPKNRVVDNLLLYNYFQPKPNAQWQPDSPSTPLLKKINQLFQVDLFATVQDKEIDVKAALIQLAACLEKKDATNAYYFCNIIDLSTEEQGRTPWLLQYLSIQKTIKIDSKIAKKMTLYVWYILFEVVKEKPSIEALLKVLYQLYLSKTGSPKLLLAFGLLLCCHREHLVYQKTELPIFSSIPQTLKELYINNQKDILARRQMSIPAYAIDKHTDRGKGSSFAPHNIADLYTEAQQKGIPVHHWSAVEIAKSHGAYQTFAPFVDGKQHSRMSHFFKEGALLRNVPAGWQGEDAYVDAVQKYFFSLEKKYGYQACSGYFIIEKMRPVWIKSQSFWKQ